MGIFDSHSDFNKWQVLTGYKQNTTKTIEGYLNIKKYTRNLKQELSHSLKELIVKDINSQPKIRIIGVSNIDTMIDVLATVKGKNSLIFEELIKKDFFEAFRYLHRLTYG